MLKEQDINRISLLLGIVEKVSTVAPGFMHITGEAMAELRLFNEAIYAAQTKERTRHPNQIPGQPVDTTVPTQPLKGDNVDLDAVRQREPTEEELAKNAHDRQVLADAGEARRRIAEAEDNRKRLEVDKKTAEEADALEKRRAEFNEREAKARAEGQQRPAPDDVGYAGNPNMVERQPSSAPPPRRPDGVPSPTNIPRHPTKDDE